MCKVQDEVGAGRSRFCCTEVVKRSCQMRFGAACKRDVTILFCLVGGSEDLPFVWAALHGRQELGDILGNPCRIIFCVALLVGCG